MANNAILGAMLLLIKTKADTSGLNKTDKALRKTGGAIKSMSKDIGLIGKLSKGFLGYLGIRGIGGMFNSYLQFEKDLGAMKSRFYAITKSDILADEEFEYIRKLATDTANDVKATADSYSIFYAAAQRSLGKEGARGIFETWTKIGRVLHLNEAQFERVTYALREMSSKGQLYSQDLKIQLGTHVPDAVNIAQEAIKSLGIAGVETVEDFQKHTKKNPKSDAMARFLKEFSRVAGERFASEEAVAKALKQPDALAKSIENIGYNFLVEFSKKGGNEVVINILNGIKDALLSIDFNALSSALVTISKGMSVVFKYLPLIFGVLKDIALSVAIFYGFKGLLSVFKFLRAGFYAFRQGGFKKIFQWLLLKFGGEIGRSVVKSMIKGAVNVGLKSVMASVLGVTGPLGWIATALMFLPEILSIIKWFANKLGYNKKEEIAKTQFGSIYEVAKRLEQDKNINSTEKLQEALAKNEATKLLWAGAQYNDNGTITININGANLTIEDIKEEALKQVAESAKNGKTGNWYSNFAQKPEDLSYMR